MVMRILIFLQLRYKITLTLPKYRDTMHHPDA